MSYPAPPPAPTPANTGAASGGFFNDLFDIRFTRFVSLRLISVVYVLILIAVSIVALVFIFAGFSQGAASGVFALIFAVLGWVIYVVLARVALEAFAVLFRIHDDTSRTADALAGSRGTVASYDPGTSGTHPYGGQSYGGATQSYGSQSYGAPPSSTQPPSPPPGGAPGDPSGPPWS